MHIDLGRSDVDPNEIRKQSVPRPAESRRRTVATIATIPNPRALPHSKREKGDGNLLRPDGMNMRGARLPDSVVLRFIQILSSYARILASRRIR